MSASVHADVVDNTKEADALFLQGRTALAANNFKEACKLFFDAQEKQRENPAILINLGLCNEKQDKIASALRWYRKTQLLTQGKTDATNKEYEDTARERVNTLQGQVSKVTFSLGTVQPNAELLIDGETIRREELIVEVDKGTHVVEARMAGAITSRQQLVVESNGKQGLTFAFVALQPAPEKKFFTKRRKIGLVVGLGVIAVTTTISGLWASDNENNPDKTDNGLFGDQLPPTLLFSAGLAVGVGVAAYAFLKGGAPREQQTAFVPTVSGNSAGFAMFRRF
jgi:hypothetical protein